MKTQKILPRKDSKIKHMPKDKLDKYYVALMKDIYTAEESLFLEELMGKNASAINEKNFGNLFGRLQGILLNNGRLCICRIFEVNRRYSLLSIPATIDYMKEHNNNLKIEQRPNLIKKLVSMGLDETNIVHLDDVEVTEETTNLFLQQLQKPGVVNSLDRIKAIRDKSIAHSEEVEVSMLPRHTYAEMDSLIKLAKDFLSAIGGGYLSCAYECDGESFPLTSDAQRASRSLKRLLKDAGVIMDERQIDNMN